MSKNHPMDTHLTRVEDRVSAVLGCNDRLRDLHAVGEERDPARDLEIRRLNATIGIGLKLAQIDALRAIAEALRERPPLPITPDGVSPYRYTYPATT